MSISNIERKSEVNVKILSSKSVSEHEAFAASEFIPLKLLVIMLLLLSSQISLCHWFVIYISTKTLMNCIINSHFSFCRSSKTRLMSSMGSILLQMIRRFIFCVSHKYVSTFYASRTRKYVVIIHPVYVYDCLWYNQITIHLSDRLRK